MNKIKEAISSLLQRLKSYRERVKARIQEKRLKRTIELAKAGFRIKETGEQFYLLHNDTAIFIFNQGSSTDFILRILKQHQNAAIEYIKRNRF